MEENIKNKKRANSEIIPFDISNFSSLQYIKLVFLDEKKELFEIRSENYKIDNDIIQLNFNNKKNWNISCPTGAVLKLITADSIHYAKTILQNVENINNKNIFTLKTPGKTMQQQNRKFYRITKDRPCALLFNNNDNVLIAQSINISKGGILISDVESLLNDQEIDLQPADGDLCHIAMFLKHNLRIKSGAIFKRKEYYNDSYRYAFQFVDMPEKYLDIFDKYMTAEEFKLLQSIKQS